jgi:transketolase C-terminal domain/subunit
MASSPVGVMLLAVGLGITPYYLVLFDTSISLFGEELVAREFDDRVHNIGRMNQRLVGIIAAIGLSIVGALLWVVRGKSLP